MKHVLEANSLSDEELLHLFQLAENYRSGKSKWTPLTGKIVATLFSEPSTRTRLSFESAMLKMGGSVISASDDSMSIKKGESLADTIETVSHYADAIVVRAACRHDDWLVNSCKVPVINAGDGPHNHPTQAFLDVYTIWREFASLGYKPRGAVPNNVKVVIIGDLGNSRSINSFVQLMLRRQSNQITLFDSSGKDSRLKSVDWLADLNYISKINLEGLKEELRTANFVYLNRVQTERWQNISMSDITDPFIFDESYLSQISPNCKILNPGPRRRETPDYVLRDPRCKIADQVENGLYLRMALLHKLLDNTTADLIQ